MLASSLRFLLKYHFCPSSQSSCKYSVFKFFIFTDRVWKPNNSKNLTVLSPTLCKYCLHAYRESFHVVCWNIFKRCHLVHTKFTLVSPKAVINSFHQLVWLIFPLNQPNCLAVWASADTFTQREGRLRVNLLNEGYSFLLRSATDLLSDCGHELQSCHPQTLFHF